MQGVVKRYNKKRNYGFALCSGNKKKVLCSKQDLVNTEYLIEGDIIDFVLSNNNCARKIFVIGKER